MDTMSNMHNIVAKKMRKSANSGQESEQKNKGKSGSCLYKACRAINVKVHSLLKCLKRKKPKNSKAKSLAVCSEIVMTSHEATETPKSPMENMVDETLYTESTRVTSDLTVQIPLVEKEGIIVQDVEILKEHIHSETEGATDVSCNVFTTKDGEQELDNVQEGDSTVQSPLVPGHVTPLNPEIRSSAFRFPKLTHEIDLGVQDTQGFIESFNTSVNPIEHSAPSRGGAKVCSFIDRPHADRHSAFLTPICITTDLDRLEALGHKKDIWHSLTSFSPHKNILQDCQDSSRRSYPKTLPVDLDYCTWE